jgi:hypothetical protein
MSLRSIVVVWDQKRPGVRFHSPTGCCCGGCKAAALIPYDPSHPSPAASTKHEMFLSLPYHGLVANRTTSVIITTETMPAEDKVVGCLQDGNRPASLAGTDGQLIEDAAPNRCKYLFDDHDVCGDHCGRHQATVVRNMDQCIGTRPHEGIKRSIYE